MLAGGLLLALLSVGLEAKPASQLPQKVGLSLPRCCAPKESLGRGGGTAGSSFPLGFLAGRRPPTHVSGRAVVGGALRALTVRDRSQRGHSCPHVTLRCQSQTRV